jgi:hypothetical protein
MRKSRSRPPANDTRPARRSLVELTAAASRAIEDGVAVMPVFPVAAAAQRPEEVANASAPVAAAKQVTAPRAVEPASEPSRRKTASPNTESSVEMLVQIAKEHQAHTLESMRLNLAAAMDYAKDLTRTPTATPMPPDGRTGRDNNLRAAVGVAAEYRNEAIELVKAQAATTLDYARALAGARTAAEFVELSSALARKQYELALKQASVLQSFAQKVTKPGGSSENG